MMNDSGAPVPYGMGIVQNSYSNTGEEFMIIRYGFVNNTGAAVSDLYAGIFVTGISLITQPTWAVMRCRKTWFINTTTPDIITV
ncbi:MAG: hypothetical protein R3C41_01920 [Calditrichia bacterium]